MARIQQTFVNQADRQIDVSIEPWPECFELAPGDKLTVVWDADENGDAIQVDVFNRSEIVAWPNGDIDRMRFFLNGKPTRTTGFPHT